MNDVAPGCWFPGEWLRWYDPLQPTGSRNTYKDACGCSANTTVNDLGRLVRTARGMKGEPEVQQMSYKRSILPEGGQCTSVCTWKRHGSTLVVRSTAARIISKIQVQSQERGHQRASTLEARMRPRSGTYGLASFPGSWHCRRRR